MSTGERLLRQLQKKRENEINEEGAAERRAIAETVPLAKAPRTVQRAVQDYLAAAAVKEKAVAVIKAAGYSTYLTSHTTELQRENHHNEQRAVNTRTAARREALTNLATTTAVELLAVPGDSARAKKILKGFQAAAGKI